MGRHINVKDLIFYAFALLVQYHSLGVSPHTIQEASLVCKCRITRELILRRTHLIHDGDVGVVHKVVLVYHAYTGVIVVNLQQCAVNAMICHI